MSNIDSKPLNLTAAAALATINRFGKLTSTGINICTVAGERADGIIGSKTKAAGEGVDLYADRIMPVEYGGTVAIGDDVATDAFGRAITASAGQFVMGQALTAGIVGQIGDIKPALARSPLAQNVADASTFAGAEVIYSRDYADAATADYDLVLSEKVEVIDVLVIKNAAGAGNTVQIKTGAGVAISDAIAAAVDKTVTRAGTIDRASNVILAGGTLRTTITRAAGSGAMKVFVYGIKRA